MQETSHLRFVASTVVLAVVMSAGQWPARSLTAAGTSPKVMSGDYSAVVVTHFVDRDIVQTWLPEGLVPADENPFERHPVLIMLGRQRNLARTGHFTIYPHWGRDYLETFVAIPYLKLKSAPEKPPVFHFARVYLNNWPATEKGIRLFGWPKYCTTLESCHDDYRVFFGRHGQVLDARTDFATSQRVAGHNPSLSVIKSMLSTPMVLEKDGQLTAYRFDFHFECARFRSVSTELSIRDGFMPHLEPIQMEVPGINEQDYGAFHFVAHFTNRKIRY